MPSLQRSQTLDAIVARILPGEGVDGLPPSEVGVYLSGHFDLYPDDARLVEAGVVVLEARSFALFASEEQDAVLAELEAHPSIALLIRLVVEGFYTSPAGYAEVGFQVTA